MCSLLIVPCIVAVFGMWLTPRSVGDAELTLGGFDSTKYSGALTYIPIDPSTNVSLYINLATIIILMDSSTGILATCVKPVCGKR
jgi:hypothetical protein